MLQEIRLPPEDLLLLAKEGQLWWHRTGSEPSPVYNDFVRADDWAMLLHLLAGCRKHSEWKFYMYLEE